jgi:16S rRNA (guanine966-N2)-methyltransferase
LPPVEPKSELACVFDPPQAGRDEWQVRVIAGKFRGRKLRVPPGQLTRPTTSRMRQGMFELLVELSDARVADLYAGRGSLVLEALSRGARHATFEDQAKGSIHAIRANLQDLGLARQSTLIAKPLERSGADLIEWGPFDLVFCDPPWADLGLALRQLSKLLRQPLLTAGGTLMIGHRARDAIDAGSLPLGLERSKRWGDSSVTIFRAAEVAGGPGNDYSSGSPVASSE